MTPSARRLLSALAVSAFLVCSLSATPAFAESCTTATFGTARYLPTPGGFAVSIVDGDFNGDGHRDFAVANQSGHVQNLTVFLGDGRGGFSLTTTLLPADVEVHYLEAGDVTGDGHVDLFGAGYSAAWTVDLVVFEGDGTGTFTGRPPIDVGTNLGFTVFSVADADNDGDLDVLLGTVNTALVPSLLVMANDGSGEFVASLDLPLDALPASLASADFNEDGLIDLALATWHPQGEGPDFVEIRLGDGRGGFGAVVSSQSVAKPASLVTGDFNEDGNVDVAVSTFPGTSYAVAVISGDGAGRLGSPVTHPAISAFALTAADVTGDGHLDLVSTAGFHTQDAIRVMLVVEAGNGDTTFAEPAVFPLRGLGAFLLRAADFNGDGRIDLAAAGTTTEFQDMVAFLPNMCGNSADLAVSVSDSHDPAVTGRQLTYEVTVANNGPDPGTATAAVWIPPALTFASARASSGVCVPASAQNAPPEWDRVVRCDLGDLAGASPGNSATITVVTTPQDGGGRQIVATVTTNVEDPVPDNNSETETTMILVALTATIATTTDGATSLSWSPRTGQAGYIVWRSAGGVESRFPPSGVLPADSTSFLDSDPAPSELNCYRVMPVDANETPIGSTPMLCQWTDTASPPGALPDFHLTILSETEVRLTWTPFGGQTGYVVRAYSLGTYKPQQFPRDQTTFVFRPTAFTCYVLIPVNGETALANSTALCTAPRAP